MTKPDVFIRKALEAAVQLPRFQAGPCSRTSACPVGPGQGTCKVRGWGGLPGMCVFQGMGSLAFQ